MTSGVRSAPVLSRKSYSQAQWFEPKWAWRSGPKLWLDLGQEGGRCRGRELAQAKDAEAGEPGDAGDGEAERA